MFLAVGGRNFWFVGLGDPGVEPAAHLAMRSFPGIPGYIRDTISDYPESPYIQEISELLITKSSPTWLFVSGEAPCRAIFLKKALCQNQKLIYC